MFSLLKGNPTLNALVATLVAASLMLATFSLFEPLVTYGQVNSLPFTVSQEITSELSFLSQPNSVAMNGSLSGLTGGRTYGTSTFNITTNGASGYRVEIAFSDAVAMQATGSASQIPNYNPAAGGALADYNFTYGAGQAFFGYTVQASTSPWTIDPTFKDDGVSTCDGTDTLETIGHCWFNKDDATVAEQIINSTSSTAGTGATSSVTFSVGVGLNPSPALDTGWYVATATLTATVN